MKNKQWASVPYSLRDEDSIKRVLEGTDVVVNMIGACYYHWSSWRIYYTHVSADRPSVHRSNPLQQNQTPDNTHTHTTGKHYDTKHAVPYKRTEGGKLSNVNFSLEEIHTEAPAKVGR